MRTPDFGHPLEDIGYTLDRLGPTAVLPDKSSAQPDVTFKSHEKKHLLMSEAKSGGVDNAQADGFKKITPEIIASQGLTSLPASGLTSELCYVCSSGNKETVLRNEKEHHHCFPVLVYEASILRKDGSTSAFQDGRLENLFAKGIVFAKPPPHNNYPFGEGDTKGWIAFHVLAAISELQVLGKSTFTERDLMLKIHPLLDYMDKKTQAYIHRVISDVLNELNLREDDDRFIIKRLRGQEWQVLKFKRTKQLAEMLMKIADEFDAKPDYEDLASFAAP